MTSLPNPFFDSAAEPCPSAEVSVVASNPTPGPDATADRFVLDVEAFMNDIEPLPAFLVAPSQAYLRATEIMPVLQVIAGH